MSQNRKRPGRTRTKRTNGRAPLLLSTIAPEDFNVRPAEPKSIACPDCRTWHRIMGDTTLKVREHVGTDRGHGKPDDRCPGSNQLVVVDIDVKKWQSNQDRLLRDAMPSDNRRAARQFYKPLPAPAAPVHRITATLTVDTARQTYLAHRARCAACTGRELCADGERLALVYVRLLHQEPKRRQVQARLDREQRQFDRRQAEQWPARRAQQWAAAGGTDAEGANNQCRPSAKGTVSEFRGPDVPLEPLRITA
jgi:hypothetical protein